MISWRKIALLTVLFLALQSWLTGPLFRPVNNSWTLIEDLTAGRPPAHKNVSSGAVGPSAAGTVIGVGRPGWGQWNFSAPGPLPTTIQPFFLPPPHTRSGVYLLTGGGERIALAEDTLLRNRSINFHDKVKGVSSFQIRFEGENALLSGVKFRQPVEPGIANKALALAFFCLALIFARGLALGDKTTMLLSALTAAGLILRWSALCAHWHIPLEGDASGYWQLARELKLSNPFATGIREPAFIWLMKLGTLFGDSERSARFVSLIFSCALIPMTWRLGRRIGLTNLTCLITATLAAFNPFSIFMASQGLQLEFFSVLILYFTELCLSDRAIAAGVTGALLILTRIQAVAAVFPLAIIAAFRTRSGMKETARRLLLPALALVALLCAAKINTGSFTGNLDHAARYYTAAEHGGPGTIAAHGNVTLGKYLFSDGSMLRLALKTLNGYVQIMFNPFNPFNRIFLNSRDSAPWNLPLLPFFWAGLWFFISGAGRRSFLLFPLFFLSGLPALQAEYREPRLLFHVAPFIFIICGAGITYAAGKAAPFFRSKT